MSDLVIRHATRGDAGALEDVIRTAYAPFRAAGVALPPVEDGVAEALSAATAWVAEFESRVIGGVFAIQDGALVYVQNLAVDPEAGGKGVGRALLNAVEVWARAVDASSLQLTTHVEMTGTQAFYRKLGWQDAGREGARLFMSKPL